MKKDSLPEIHEWWKNNSDEKFWLEVTGRTDIGVNLKAPQSNENGNEFWSYSFIKLVNAGDIVFHYDRSKQAITSKSKASGQYWEDKIVWAARGAYAREAGIQPHIRDGWYLGLENFQELAKPLKLDDIRQALSDVIRGTQKLINEVGSPLYFPFEIGDLKRPTRPMQGYLFKLPSFFISLFRELYTDTEINILEDRSNYGATLGMNYRVANEETSVAKSDPFDRDPTLIERALASHAKTQNGLANFLLDENIIPRSPSPHEPDFDLAWIIQDEIWVAEIKSTNSSNEEKQLRLGLGQLLRYCQMLDTKKNVHGVLVIEKAPKDASWEILCERHNIILVWPEVWDIRLKRAMSR
jgi:hypothetical protein